MSALALALLRDGFIKGAVAVDRAHDLLRLWLMEFASACDEMHWQIMEARKQARQERESADLFGLGLNGSGSRQ